MRYLPSSPLKHNIDQIGHILLMQKKIRLDVSYILLRHSLRFFLFVIELLETL